MSLRVCMHVRGTGQQGGADGESGLIADIQTDMGGIIDGYC